MSYSTNHTIMSQKLRQTGASISPPQENQPLSQTSVVPAHFLRFAQRRYPAMKQACQKKNTARFHECCFTFSTKAKTAKLNHPADESVPFQRFLQTHAVDSVESFAAVIYRMSLARSDGLTGLLPTYNRSHPEQPHLDKRQQSPETGNAQPMTVEEKLKQLETALQMKEQECERLQKENTLVKLALRCTEQDRQRLDREQNRERASAMAADRNLMSRRYECNQFTKILKYQDHRLPFKGIRDKGKRRACEIQTKNPERRSFRKIERPRPYDLPIRPPPVPAPNPELEALLIRNTREVIQTLSPK